MTGNEQLIRGDDIIQPFTIEGTSLRGRIVRLGGVADAIIARHGYPDAVSRLLGEGLALTAVIGGGMKFEGIFTLQMKGEGPVSLMVCDYCHDGALRGYVSFDAAAVAALDEDAGFRALTGGGGYLALTLDQGAEMERYQGIVSLEGERLSDCAREYFRQSEQLDSWIMLAAGHRGDAWRAGALMLQPMPPQEGEDKEKREEDWRRATTLAETLRDEELLDPALGASDLLYRLYHEDGVRLYDVIRLHDRCRCSRERVLRALQGIDRKELAEIADEQGDFTARCDFCSQEYRIPAEELLGS